MLFRIRYATRTLKRLDKFKTNDIVEGITSQVNERRLKAQVKWGQGRWQKQHGTVRLRGER
jgi:hypothetical protein